MNAFCNFHYLVNIMAPEVIAAIITGAVALIAPIATYFATIAYERRSIQKISGRRKSIVGNWRGNIKQSLKGAPVTIDIEMGFTAGNKIIEGNCRFLSPLDNRTTNLKFTGGFYHERFIKFDYKNEDEGVIQFGSSIIDLSADGRTMTGSYVGYGAGTNEIVTGNVILNRVF